MTDNIVRIIVAAILGFIIGLANKSVQDSPSGIVFSMICIGAALTTIVSTDFFKMLSLPWVSDPGRISAQVISALGFIGVGLIWITENNEVRGLSAIASLWITAILGMLIGAGLNRIAIIGIFFLLFIYWLSNRVIDWRKR